jgi:hypothetical protein
MLNFDIKTGNLSDPDRALVFSDRPYRYAITATRADGQIISDTGLDHKVVTATSQGMTLQGDFVNAGVTITQDFRYIEDRLEEIISIKNESDQAITIDDIELGFCANLKSREDWHLCAIPFKVQIDGSRHDYSGDALVKGQFHNAVFVDDTRQFMPELKEKGRLRSEAFAWGIGESGLLIAKYNTYEIELSVASTFGQGEETWLRFGGAGFCLYGEPSGARQLAAGQSSTFGTTVYIPYLHGQNEAFTLYRNFLDARGHTFPANYDPPVNWNELYDVGWYHSNPEKLKSHYTRKALLGEAQKAKEVGCELLYLDPGWEICEGTTLWDETRLGSVRSLVETLKKNYSLDLGYRTILRTYKDYWPAEYMVKHNDQPYQPILFGDQYFWEPCLCNPVFWQEKLNRILAISEQGVRFMMVDEMDWRGPCYATHHGHPVPTTPLDHVMAVYKLCAAIRKTCPELTIECHDPVWPWSSSIYVPTYLHQGFDGLGQYDENWGFEYMWDCLNDLRSGRALALYYYNLACNVPIYLHITMAADNDDCIFFWWVASTVRHLGIGGRDSSPTIEPAEGLPPRDKEKRFEAYKAQMDLYQKFKPYFVRGTFHGLTETAHLHTLPGVSGGVLNLFNLTDSETVSEIFIPVGLLQTEQALPVEGAGAQWRDGGVIIRKRLDAMSPALVIIGSIV